MRVPFHRQRLDFTCGPASLIMAMRAFDPRVSEDVAHEIDIWREATMAVVPATTRYGLALAARARGFGARIVANVDGPAFRARMVTRMPDFYDEASLGVLWEDRRERARAAGIPEERRRVTTRDLSGALEAGEVPILLTSTRHFGDPDDVPHWVVVAEHGADGFLVLNPLDDAPATVRLTDDAMGRVLGFAGDEELVVVGPRE